MIINELIKKLTEKLETADYNGEEYTKVRTRTEHLANNFNYEVDFISEFIDSLKAWKVKCILTIKDGEGNVFRKTSGSSCKVVGSSEICETSCLEFTETMAFGRACGFAGIGIKNSNIASHDEVEQAKENSKNVKAFKRTDTAKAAEKNALAKLTGKA